MPLISSNSIASAGLDDEAATSYADRICLTELLAAQNTDGGWGYRAGGESRVEPSSWALLALTEMAGAAGTEEAMARGLRFLESTQLADGSWPAAAGQVAGCWVTSLASLVMVARNGNSQSLARALAWLSAERPGDSGFAWKLRSRLRAKRSVSSQNDFLYGWSWTRGTASWVEPTSFAVIALGAAPQKMQPPSARERLQIAEAMLFDRMCPGGGWNCGNPMVYGVAGEPQVGPTVWALLALRNKAARPEVQKSLAWLESNLARVRTQGSLALTQLAFRALDHRTETFDAGVSRREFDSTGDSIPGVSEMAWSVLAASTNGPWSKLLQGGKS